MPWTACADLDIEHRLISGVARAQTAKSTDETDDQGGHRQAPPYETHDQLRQHRTEFVAAYNFARRLKALSGLTAYEATM